MNKFSLSHILFLTENFNRNFFNKCQMSDMYTFLVSFPGMLPPPPPPPPPITAKDTKKTNKKVTQTARLILRERVDFARQQPDRNRQNRAATVDSCFVLIGTRQHGVAVLYETSDRASSNKMQQNPCPIKFRTLNPPAPRITRCHITCLREKADKASNSCLAKSTECRWTKPS